MLPVRALKVGRVTVNPGDEASYVQTVHALASLAQERGLNIWVFRHSQEPGSFCEFIEAANEAALRETWTPDEAAMVNRLREIATYAPGSSDLWHEIPPPPGRVE
ncbi:MAG: hypothetical protein HKM89_12225 [Gemmatimonadales bacterium]|nr:hypothetical protein [Gemmatimonadales bacterium]